MTDDSKRESELHVDEDWKERVKAEDAALDAKLRDESHQAAPATEPAGQTPPDDRATSPKPETAATRKETKHPPLPTAGLATLVGMLTTQAMIALGLVPNPANQQPELQLDVARHFIDLLAVLEDKTRGNLDAGEKQLLETTLHELRVVYLERTKTQ